MTKNIALWDRISRVVVGLALLAFVGPHSAWGWLGLIPFATGLVGMCPLYRVLGVSTCAAPKPPGDAPLHN
ncbi:MAG: hypothetical protein RL685_190 [Pseudomonadota bacterium]|jgi:hypothetical protein